MSIPTSNNVDFDEITGLAEGFRDIARGVLDLNKALRAENAELKAAHKEQPKYKPLTAEDLRHLDLPTFQQIVDVGLAALDKIEGIRGTVAEVREEVAAREATIASQAAIIAELHSIILQSIAGRK